MEYDPPKPIELTKDEAKWNDQISLTLDEKTEWSSQIADSMKSLFESLYERDAIPKIRLRVFEDPVFAETRGKSPKQVFESNGRFGDAICQHPHFIKYLRYFINGPDLPATVISGFCKILNDDIGTSGIILDKLRRYVRSCVREYGLDRISAASEFYKLAVELNIDDRHSIRQAAMSIR
jgi:hypothetical protein